MHEKNLSAAALIESALTPVDEHTHIAYAVDNEWGETTLTKIGVAHANDAGDITLSLDPALPLMPDNIIICRKAQGN